MSEQAPFPDPFEFLNKMWATMGLPMAGAVAPPVNVDEIDRRIADLKSVEQWLSMNLNMLRVSIQGLEMQKATLAALRAMQLQPDAKTLQADAEASRNPAVSAAEAWWNLLQQTQVAADPKSEKKAK